MKRKDIWHKFNRMNLDVKLQWYIASLIVATTLLMLIISTLFTVRSLYQKSEEAAESQLAFLTANYASWLDRNKDMMMALQMDPAIQKFCICGSPESEDYGAARTAVMETIINQINMSQETNFISVTNTYLDAYVYNGNLSITKTGFEEAYQECLEDSRLAKSLGTFRVNFGNQFFKGSKYTVTFYQPIYSSTHVDEQIGMLCMNLNDNMQQIMNSAFQLESLETCMTDQNGMLIMSAKKHIQYKEDSYRIADFGGRREGRVFQNGSYYFFRKIGTWNYYIISVVPLSYLFRSSVEVTLVMLMVMLLLLGVSMIAMRMIVKKNYEPLAKVVKAMDHISNDAQHELGERIDTDDMGADFKKLGRGFNSMMDDIAKLMNTVLDEQHQMDQIRFNALQAQIQPHFLYNTLECIHWQSSADGNKKVSKLVMALASYYRLALSQGQDIIPLKQELEHIQYYLMIQNERYGDMIHYNIQVDEEFLAVKIPKLTLQPLVENSIYHGIRVKAGSNGSITIRGFREGETAVLKVTDSGLGMTEKQIREMNQSISDYDEQFGYGVRNVNKRIELMFGQEYGLGYQINEQGGVTVLIRLPMVFDEP